jgi:hypothetical protein
VSILDDAGRSQVNDRLCAWRQGDFVAEGEHWFLFGIDAQGPLTEAGSEAAAENAEAASIRVSGFLVISQTCDIVRDCGARPFIEVCPLVKVDAPTLHATERGRMPRYAFIPGAAERNLVADLDRIMTVEKSVVANWNREDGCHTDADTRRLSLALARKRQRFAFPDDFGSLAKNLIRRMSSKHDKNSDEGRALRSLREVRVTAMPSWDADEIKLLFLFIRNEDDLEFGGRGWDDWLRAWLERLPESDRFVEVDGIVTTLEDITARDYVESDALDLDHLSTRER